MHVFIFYQQLPSLVILYLFKCRNKNSLATGRDNEIE